MAIKCKSLKLTLVLNNVIRTDWYTFKLIYSHHFYDIHSSVTVTSSDRVGTTNVAFSEHSADLVDVLNERIGVDASEFIYYQGVSFSGTVNHPAKSRQTFSWWHRGPNTLMTSFNKRTTPGNVQSTGY